MKKLPIPFLITLIVAAGVYGQNPPNDFVLVKGGSFIDKTSNYYGKHVTISSFYIDKYDVTQKEWTDVMGTNPSKFKGDSLPVDSVTWYDAIEYCNARSVKEGLQPYYNLDKNKIDPNNYSTLDGIKWTVTINPKANGYRLPTEAEFEYAAEGGQLSKGYKYAGGNDVDKVAWYFRNSGDKPMPDMWLLPAIQGNHDRTHPVGEKNPNELGLYDMSGNVREWCWDWDAPLTAKSVTDPKGPSKGSERVWRGGGWLGAGFCCKTSFRASLGPNQTGPDQGLRVCRND